MAGRTAVRRAGVSPSRSRAFVVGSSMNQPSLGCSDGSPFGPSSRQREDAGTFLPYAQSETFSKVAVISGIAFLGDRLTSRRPGGRLTTAAAMSFSGERDRVPTSASRSPWSRGPLSLSRDHKPLLERAEPVCFKSIIRPVNSLMNLATRSSASQTAVGVQSPPAEHPQASMARAALLFDKPELLTGPPAAAALHRCDRFDTRSESV